MSVPCCPYCGTQCTDAAGRGASTFVCRTCGKAVEPPLAGNGVPPPPLQAGGRSDRWSDGPPPESADRWSTQSPLGDDSSSSESVSQTSILPAGESEQGALVRPPRSPLVWALLVLVLFLAALIGVVLLARWMRPRLEARRTAAQQATIEYWLPRLVKGSDADRQEAARAIVALGPDAVCRTLDHISPDPGDEQHFHFVPGAVRALASAGAEAVPGLCEGLRSPEARVRAVAVEVLQQMGADGRGARDGLLATLDDPNLWVRHSTIDTLGYLGADGAPAAKRLTGLIASADLFARRHAIEALGRIGPEARDASTEALKKAKDDDPDLEARRKAALALKQVEVAHWAYEARRNATGEFKQWLKALEGDDTPAAVAAAEALGNLGFEDGKPAAPGLALMLRHADRQRRLAAARALRRLGLAAADFTLTLEAATRDEDGEVRAAAAKALEPPGGGPATNHETHEIHER